MEFDHLGDKLGDMGNMVRRASRRVIEAEIAKCELVCVVCHRRRTAKRAGW